MYVRNLMLTLALALASVAPAVAAAPMPNAASVEEVGQVMRLAAMDKLAIASIRRGIESGNRGGPESAIDADIYMTFVSSDSIVAHMAPLIATYLSHDYAAKLIAGLRAPAAKTAVRLRLLHSEAGIEAARAAFRKLPPAEQRAVNAFTDSLVYKSLLNAENKAQPEIQTMFRDWSGEEMEGRAKRVRKQMADLIEQELRLEGAAADGEAAADLNLPNQLPRTGMRSFDEETLVSLESMRRNVRMNRQFALESKALKHEDVLKPENLVTRQGLEAGNLTLLAAQNLFETHAKAYESLGAEFDRRVDAIPMSDEHRKKSRAQYAQQTAALFDLELRTAEHVRTIIEVEKQILALCESLLGKIEIENGKMVVRSNADVLRYNTLLAQIRREEDEIKQIEAEDVERRKQIAARLRAM
ncbi:MAG: hypothetical protein V4582_17450 [Pseudomonadota bacterium]